VTWREFKEWVDRQLAEKGISEDTPIWFIDLSFPDVERIDIESSAFVQEGSGLAIC
jgi:hypothetical protein